MEKHESEVILKACKVHGIDVKIEETGTEIKLVFLVKTGFESFDAAKWMTNACVAEKKYRSKKRMIQFEKGSQEKSDLSFFYNRHHKHKRDSDFTLAERHEKSDN